MKRINPEDAHFYVKLTGDDPRKMEKAVAFTLTDRDWETVFVYYGQSILFRILDQFMSINISTIFK